MKTISIYELIGLVNDNQAPKKIKYECGIYLFSPSAKWYFEEDGNIRLDWINGFIDHLNDEVEVINEIEKLKIEQNKPNSNYYYIRNEYGTKCGLSKHSKMIADKVNELVEGMKDIYSILNEHAEEFQKTKEKAPTFNNIREQYGLPRIEEKI